MSEDIQMKAYFNLAQFLGSPTIMPPVLKGKQSVSVQFIIPSLKLGNRDKDKVIKIGYVCGIELYGIKLYETSNERTKEPATLVEMAFYINPSKTKEETTTILTSTSRLLVERFLGLLSFMMGLKLSAVYIQPNTSLDGKTISKIIPPSSKSTRSPTKVIMPEIIDKITNIPEDIFSALYWLRRGLAERDPVENFSALMVCLQIMAKHLISKKYIPQTCPHCGELLETKESSISSLTRELITSILDAPKDSFKRLWEARNAIVAHGNKPVTAEVFLELADLKMEAMNLAFKSIKLGLGIPLDSPPSPNPNYYITDAFMHVD